MPALSCWPATSTSTTPLCWAENWHEPSMPVPEQPFVLELGCGKGGFLSQLARAHPENNYLGIDITDKVLILAKRKVEAAYQAADRPIDNVKIMSAWTLSGSTTSSSRRTPSAASTSTSATRGARTVPPTSTASPTPASSSSTGHSLRTAVKFTSRPMTTTCSATVWSTSPLPAMRSPGRPLTCTRTSRSGTSAPSTRACSPKWASRSRP